MATCPASPSVRRALASVLVLALAFALGLAGCARSDADAPASALQDAVASLSGEDAASALGQIRGVVQSLALEPLKGARVTMLREGASTLADASGLYRFDALPPGSYLLSAEAEGFAAASAVADARNGTITLVNFTLAPAPKLEPYHQTQELKGLLSCAVAAQSPAGETRRDCAAADPNHRDDFEFPIGALARSAVIELVWDAASDPAAKRLNLHARTLGYGASDADLGNVTGEGYARILVPSTIMEKYYGQGGAMRARIALADDGSPPAGVAFQRAFTLYVTTFYVEPGADGFTVVKT